MLGRRFLVAMNDVVNDARYMAKVPKTRSIFAAPEDVAGQDARRVLAEQFRTMLSVHPEYFQVRLISAAHNGIELVRVDRDGGNLKRVEQPDLQGKGHYPYVFRTLNLAEGQIHFSKIFLNREEGAHSALNQPTLQVATPVVSAGGEHLGIIVINADTGAIFCVSDALELEDEIPDDIETSDRYIALPHKNDLNLGRDLVLDFVDEELPKDYDTVAGFFRHKGAYARFKDLLETRDRIDRWYAFEAAATEHALRAWCLANGMALTDEPPLA